MKNKLKVVICVVMTCLFLLIPFSAFAATGYPTSFKQATSIVDTYSTELGLDEHVPIFLYKYNNKPCLIYLPKEYYDKDPIQVSKYGDTGEFDFYHDHKGLICVSFSSLNMFSKPIIEYKDTNVWNCIKGMTKDTYKDVIIESGKTVLDVDGSTVLFQWGTHQSPNPTNPDNPIQGSNTLSSMLSKNSQMLKQVLNEIVMLLPLLLPILIQFLAIRKGIAFCLQMLKTS